MGKRTGPAAVALEETGGPPVQEPTSRGFGTRSVIASIQSQLGGEARFDWRSEGLLCHLSVPLSPPGRDDGLGRASGQRHRKQQPARSVRSADADFDQSRPGRQLPPRYRSIA